MSNTIKHSNNKIYCWISVNGAYEWRECVVEADGRARVLIPIIQDGEVLLHDLQNELYSIVSVH